VLAPAKINLFLHVGAPDAGGYHPLSSLMVFADVGDDLRAAPAARFDLAIEGPFGPGLPADPSNLVWRAAAALAGDRPLPATRLVLDKQLPIASGLGGGSSDAGAALRLLRETPGLWVDDERLEAIAASLGADGAACLWARPVLAQGRGERLSAAPPLPPTWAVLANAGAPVSTPVVYRALDASGGFGDIAPPAFPAFRDAAALATWLADQRNDLEALAIATEPLVGEVLAALAAGPSTLLARVSGSGGTCFALCASAKDAARLAADLAEVHPDWWVQACRLA
jgi:4-diphosphocytidyl-2-C-methyl-D-erythritol kinase